MTDWLQDPRAERGEIKTFEAERKERRKQFAEARASYREAADEFASVALSVPTDSPNMRSDLGIAAVACYARAGRFDLAVEIALRLLAEGEALSEPGRAELHRLAQDYELLVSPIRISTKRASAVHQVRSDVRAQFGHKAGAA